uniref:Uncharacterized protein n=1 Tax=Setaria italica TaxID=4555 RepID=K3XUG0_SETIT
MLPTTGRQVAAANTPTAVGDDGRLTTLSNHQRG